MGKELQVLRSRRNSLQQYSFSVFSSSTLVAIPQKLIPFIYAELDSGLGTTAVTERRTWQNLLPALQFTLRLSHCFLRILTHVPSDIRLFQSSDQKIYSLDFFFLTLSDFRFLENWEVEIPSNPLALLLPKCSLILKMEILVVLYHIYKFILNIIFFLQL